MPNFLVFLDITCVLNLVEIVDLWIYLKCTQTSLISLLVTAQGYNCLCSPEVCLRFGLMLI